MKTSIAIIVLLIGFQLGTAQEFTNTDAYALTSNSHDKGQEYPPYLIHVTTSDDTLNELATIALDSKEFLGDLTLSILKTPGLEDVTEIIKVDIPYELGCEKIVSHYFIVGKDWSVTELPAIENRSCDDVLSDAQYIFPNQQFGEEGLIKTIQLCYDETNTIETIDVVRNIVWNDDEYLKEATVEEAGR